MPYGCRATGIRHNYKHKHGASPLVAHTIYMHSYRAHVERKVPEFLMAIRMDLRPDSWGGKAGTLYWVASSGITPFCTMRVIIMHDLTHKSTIDDSCILAIFLKVMGEQNNIPWDSDSF